MFGWHEPLSSEQTADIAAANRLAAAVLGRSLDELAPQTRTLLMHLDAFIGQRAAADGRQRAAVRFTRREIREAIHWGADQVDTHLARLERLELEAKIKALENQKLWKDLGIFR